MKVTEEIKNDVDAENREIDCSIVWKTAPMPTKHSTETLAGMFFLFGKAICEEDDAEGDFKNNILVGLFPIYVEERRAEIRFLSR